MRIHGNTFIRLADQGLKTLFPPQQQLAAFTRTSLAATGFHQLRPNIPFATRSISFLSKPSIGLVQQSDLIGKRSLSPNLPFIRPQHEMWGIMSQGARFYTENTPSSFSSSWAFGAAMHEFYINSLTDARLISESLGEKCHQYYDRIQNILDLAGTVPPETLKSDPHFSSLVKLSVQIAPLIEVLANKEDTTASEFIMLKRLYTIASFLADRTEIEILGYQGDEPHLLRRVFNPSFIDHAVYKELAMSQGGFATRIYCAKNASPFSITPAFEAAIYEFYVDSSRVSPLSDSLKELCHRYFNNIAILKYLAETMPPENLKSDPHFLSLLRLSTQIADSIKLLAEQPQTTPEQLKLLKCLYTTASFLADRIETEILQYKESEPRDLRKTFNSDLIDDAIYKRLTLK